MFSPHTFPTICKGNLYFFIILKNTYLCSQYFTVLERYVVCFGKRDVHTGKYYLCLIFAPLPALNLSKYSFSLIRPEHQFVYERITKRKQFSSIKGWRRYGRKTPCIQCITWLRLYMSSMREAFFQCYISFVIVNK